MPPWYKSLGLGSSRKSSKGSLKSESEPQPQSATIKTQPIAIPSTSKSGSSNNGRQNSVDTIEGLEEHTAKYGSSPSHAKHKDKPAEDTTMEEADIDDGDEPKEPIQIPNGDTGAGTDLPVTHTILSNPLPSNSVSALASQLASTSVSSAGTSTGTNNAPTTAPSHASNATTGSNIRTFDVDDMIARLLDAGYTGKVSKTVPLKHPEITAICQAAREVFLSQPTLLELSAPVKIVGDVHGQYSDLIRMFEMCGFPPSSNYLFLGDYVDRGKQSLETILLLLCYKIKYPENFFLLRGNHECANVTRVYGFYDECKRRCNIKIWKTFIDVFNCLPIAAIVASKIFCVHGGLSPSLSQMEDIRKISRPTDVPDYGLLNDLLWSDPSDTAIDWEDNERGVSYCYGKMVIAEFLQRYDFDLICRAHMVVEDGYEFWNERTLVTIFSAPNYCGDFDNFGAVLTCGTDLLCSFELLKPLDGAALKKELTAKRRKHTS